MKHFNNFFFYLLAGVMIFAASAVVQAVDPKNIYFETTDKDTNVYVPDGELKAKWIHSTYAGGDNTFAGNVSVSGRSNFSDNIKITPTSESWAEGIQFYMPTQSTWGGLRWVRNRTNYHGSWYLGYTALDATNDLVFGANDGGTQRDNILRLTTAGNVGIGGAPDAAYVLKVYGKTFSDSGYDSSDVRWKKNITGLDGALDKVLNLRGVSYEWNKEKYPDRGFDDGKQIGVIAQEIEEIFPELVETDSEGYKAVAYDKLTAVLIEAVKELKKEVEELKAGR